MKAFVAILASALLAVVLVALTTSSPDEDASHDEAHHEEAEAQGTEVAAPVAPAPDLANAPKQLTRDATPPATRPVPTGRLAPDFTLPLANGDPLKLSNLRGSVVVLDFWATWCGPCMQVLPHVDALSKWAATSGKPIHVYAVHTMERGSNEETVAAVATKWRRDNFSTLVLFDFDAHTAINFGVRGIPHTFVIGPEGHIVADHRGFVRGQDLTAKLKQECLWALGE